MKSYFTIKQWSILSLCYDTKPQNSPQNRLILFLGLNSLILHTNKIAFKRFQMVNLNKIYNSCMYNYYESSIQYKKPSNLEELTKKFFKVKRDWCDSVRKTGYYIEIEASSEFLVTRGRHTFKNENRKTWLFSSLLLVNFPAFRYPWIAIRLESISNTFYMQGWKLSRCVNVNQLLIERAISHLCPRVEISNIISQSKLNEKTCFQ